MRDAADIVEHLIAERRYAEARHLLATAYAREPTSVTAAYAAARIAVGEDDLSGAMEHVESILERDAGHRGANLLAFALLVDAGRLDEAARIIDSLTRESEIDALPDVLRAELLTADGDVAGAWRAAHAAMVRAPNDPIVRRQASLVATLAGDASSAPVPLVALLRADPETARSAHTLFATLVEQQRDVEALRIVEALHDARPDDATLADAVLELRASTHPLARPAYPLTRWGTHGAAVTWLIGVLTIQVLRLWSLTATGIFTGLFVLYVIYAWAHRPLLKRRLAREHG